MATATKGKGKSKGAEKDISSVYLEGGTQMSVPLEQITGNKGQSRKLGILSSLQAEGWGLFEKISADKKPLKDMLLSDDESERKKAIQMILDTSTSDSAKGIQGIPDLAYSIKDSGLLQPIGLLKTGDDDYEIMFGGRRFVAFLYNLAEDPENSPDEIPATVWDVEDLHESDLLLISLKENNDRQDESPIERAMAYEQLCTEYGYGLKSLGRFLGKSHQHVKQYRDLLKPALKKFRDDIHNRKLSVDAAIKKLRPQGDSAGATRNGNDRNRFLPMKRLESAYLSLQKPDWMEDPKEWDLYQDEGARKYIAFYCGLKYIPFSDLKPPKVEEPKNKGKGKGKGKEESEANGKPASGKTLKVKVGRAKQLMVALGKTDARTWDNNKLEKALNNIPGFAEQGQDISSESESLNKLLRKLEEAYKEGTKVVLDHD